MVINIETEIDTTHSLTQYPVTHSLLPTHHQHSLTYKKFTTHFPFLTTNPHPRPHHSTPPNQSISQKVSTVRYANMKIHATITLKHPSRKPHPRSTRLSTYWSPSFSPTTPRECISLPYLTTLHHHTTLPFHLTTVPSSQDTVQHQQTRHPQNHNAMKLDFPWGRTV